MPLHLEYAALSDVGRVRKDNQDSGYAGPHLLAVCDGVGGAARGDIASSTALTQLARLDDAPASDLSEDLLGAIAGAIHRAHDRIGELVDEDPALNGTSTTVTLALFDGSRVGIGHVGDSRAYLYRSRELTQLTTDHTFVQSLIDEGRITEEESRTHPHRNLILKAVDGVHETEPDLFTIELAPGDRLFLCSDGASGVLDLSRLADILGSGTPDYAAVEVVRASLEAGTSDNVTCVVADVLDGAVARTGPSAGEPVAEADRAEAQEPMVVGAAAELPRRRGGGVTAVGGLFRGHRSGDTGELEAVPGDASDVPPGVSWAIPNDPLDTRDPEHARYAPRPPRRLGWLRVLLVLAVVAGLVWIGVAAAWSWSQRQYFVAEHQGMVTIFRGVNTDLPGIELNTPFETSDVAVERLSTFDAEQVAGGIDSNDLDEARETVDNLAARQDCESDSTEPGTSC